MQLSPERPEGYAALGQLYVQTDRRLSEAKTLARKAVELEPVAVNYFLLSTACDKNHDYGGALTAIQRAMDLDPGNLRYREAFERIHKKPSNSQETIK
jgi:cytochrome c-type biogenesis protein CcmH/NrfG